MNPPFTKEGFLQVFEQYNLSVYPAQFFLYLLALISLFFLVRKNKLSSKIISGVLALLWVWAGIVYHWLFFTGINKAAYIFGGLFVLQGILLFIAGMREKMVFTLRKDGVGLVGWFFIIYALLIYPILGSFFGHIYPAKPTFGLPCPLVIFTFGMLLQSRAHLPRHILVIPGLWAIIGFSAVLLFGIYEDFMLLIAAIVGIVLFFLRKRPSSNKA